MITIAHVSCGYNNKAVLSDVSLQLEPGKAVCILGCNGTGKTTLLRTLLRLIPPLQGSVLVDDMPIRQVNYRQLAKLIAYVPQARPFAYQHPAIDVVVMGRAQYIKSFSVPSDDDYYAAEEAMAILGIQALAKRPYSILSGGEQQLVLIARALAQHTKYLFLDEPAANLDLANQGVLLNTIKALKEKQVGVLMISHSPQHALYCCDNTLMVSQSGKCLFGPTRQVVTTETIQWAYGTNEIELVESFTASGKAIQTCSFV